MSVVVGEGHFGHTQALKKSQGQGSNPCHSRDQSRQHWVLNLLRQQEPPAAVFKRWVLTGTISKKTVRLGRHLRCQKPKYPELPTTHRGGWTVLSHWKPGMGGHCLQTLGHLRGHWELTYSASFLCLKISTGPSRSIEDLGFMVPRFGSMLFSSLYGNISGLFHSFQGLGGNGNTSFLQQCFGGIRKKEHLLDQKRWSASLSRTHGGSGRSSEIRMSYRCWNSFKVFL